MVKRVCVIVPAKNEATRLPKLLASLKRWVRRPQIVVVANGCTDNTATVARRYGAEVIEFTEALGHDVGRAVGLAAVDADVYVIVDADVTCHPRELEPFVKAVSRGVDLALNKYPLPKLKAYRHPTSVTKRTLNLFLDRPDLGAASLTAVPHAISRHAVETLGAESFVVPPVAQTLAVLRGLKVESVANVHVGMRNPMRDAGHRNTMRRLILGDCLEAMHVLIQARGTRGGFTDLDRKREVLSGLLQVRELQQSFADVVFPSAAVVPVKNEATSIKVVVSSLQRRVGEVCVVSNGSKDGTSRVAQRLGAHVEEFADALGHDVGRAIGCISVPARRYIFTDGDFALNPKDMRPFIRPPRTVDIALNQFDKIVPPGRQLDAVSVVKRFLNIAVNRMDLGSASLTAVPHSIHRRVMDAIGVESLMVPPLAHVKAVLAGFKVEAVHAVDVVKPNRFRLHLHGLSRGRPLERMIIGDHLEAIAYLLAERGERGGYVDRQRRRDAVSAWQKARGLKNGGLRGKFSLKS